MRALAQFALAHACSRNRSLPLHLVVSSRLATPYSSAMLGIECTVYPFSRDHVPPTWLSDTQRTKALVFVLFVPLVQELEGPDLYLLPVHLQFLLQTLELQPTIFIPVSLLPNSLSISFNLPDIFCMLPAIFQLYYNRTPQSPSFSHSACIAFSLPHRLIP